MSNETQSRIFEAYLPAPHYSKVWINLETVSTVVRTTTPDETSSIRITLTNGEAIKLTNDESASYTMWADQFINAFNAFHNQN